MARRNLENPYIPVNRATNDKFRRGYDGVRWDNKYPEEVKGEAMDAQLRREMKKGRVLGHFC